MFKNHNKIISIIDDKNCENNDKLKNNIINIQNCMMKFKAPTQFAAIEILISYVFVYKTIENYIINN